MKEKLAGVLLAALSVVSSLPSPAASQEAWPICGLGKRVTCIVDGDTFWLDGTKYRIENINAPEAGDHAQCGRERQQADAATRELQRLMTISGLQYQTMGMDRYDRVLVRIQSPQGDLGELMVRNGFARPWKGHYAKDHWCRL